MNKFIKIGIIASLVIGLSACDTDATVASRNLSKAADMFEINRRIVFYNGITDSYMLTIEGLCSIDTNASGKTFFVTCKTGPSEYKKHFLGISNNVTYFSEQIDSAKVSAYHYRVVFKPQSIIPNIDLEVSGKELGNLIN